jgi:AraC-like DNA-binding protein
MGQIISAVVAFGVFLSLFFFSILLAKPCRGGANRYMALFVLSAGLSISYEVLFPTGLYRRLPFFVKTYIPPQFLLGPLLFFYVSAITEPSFRFTKRMLLHFLPFLVSLLYLAPFFLESAQAKIAFVQSTVTPARPSSAEEWLIWLSLQASLWAYSLLALRKYREYGQMIKETVSDISRYVWNWLHIFLVCIQGMLIAFLGLDLLMLNGVPLVAFNPIISLGMTGSIVFLGWRGLLRLDYISPAPPEERLRPSQAEERSSGEWEALFAQAEGATRARALFRSPELTLPELAQALGYSRTELSKIVNLGGGMNFYDFINKLRVEDARRRLEAGDCSSVLDAALESGFNTKSTFHEAFKKWTGMTPSAYRKQHAIAEASGATRPY